MELRRAKNLGGGVPSLNSGCKISAVPSGLISHGMPTPNVKTLGLFAFVPSGTGNEVMATHLRDDRNGEQGCSPNSQAGCLRYVRQRKKPFLDKNVFTGYD